VLHDECFGIPTPFIPAFFFFGKRLVFSAGGYPPSAMRFDMRLCWQVYVETASRKRGLWGNPEDECEGARGWRCSGY
jgi:hypothetical protein